MATNISDKHSVNPKVKQSQTKLFILSEEVLIQLLANNADPDQTAPKNQVYSAFSAIFVQIFLVNVVF